MRCAGILGMVISATLFVGCQSCTSVPTQIVGDSMSQWNTGAGCGCGSCGLHCPDFAAAGSCGSGGTCMGGGCGGMCLGGGCGAAPACGPVPACGPGMGCCGNDCDMRCGGNCGVAQMKSHMAAAQQMKAIAMSNPCVAKVVHCARHKANYGCHSGPMGPQHGQVTFPYYTVRGPRDFLNPNPPSIGPGSCP